MLWIAVALVSASEPAADWPQFRGPGGLGVSRESRPLPERWSATEGLRWKVSLPARGVSSPVIADGIVYLTCSSGRRDDRLHVLAYRADTGEQLWQRQIAATGITTAHPMTCMAAPTPVADRSGVYALFATADCVCINADGSVRWIRCLNHDYPGICNQAGMAASPVLAGGKLIIPMDNAGTSFLAALDTATGENVWKVERERESNWVTPLVRETGATPEIIYASSRELIAYDAATGRKLWTHPSVSAMIPSACMVDDTIFAPGRGTVAWKFEAGQIAQRWASNKLACSMGSPTVFGREVYAVNRAGVLNVADRDTGKDLWNEMTSDKAHASPIAGDGKVFIFDQSGKAFVFKAGREADLLAKNDLGEEVLGTPAISGGAIFVRTDATLFCIGTP